MKFMTSTNAVILCFCILCRITQAGSHVMVLEQQQAPLVSLTPSQEEESITRLLNEIAMTGKTSLGNPANKFEFEACFCHWNLDGTSQCRDPQQARFNLLDFAFEICITSQTEGVVFTQVQDFAYVQGTQFDIMIAHGERAMIYFGESWGVGTNRLILDGHWASHVASYNSDNFMWELFKRSIRAFRYPNLTFYGTVVAAANGRFQDVPFRVDVPVESFRPGPFLSKKPSFFIAGANNKAADGFETRRYGFALFCIFAVAAMGFALRDLFLLFQLIRWACCRTKRTKNGKDTQVDAEYGRPIQEFNHENQMNMTVFGGEMSPV